MFPIKIAVGDVNLEGELFDSECARAVARALPLTAEFSVWGDELHFDVAIDEGLRGRPDARVTVGDLALATEQATLCIFFGPTPLSGAEEPVAAVPVTVVGRIEDSEKLRAAKESGQISLTSGA
jgi:hypothetical protein